MEPKLIDSKDKYEEAIRELERLMDRQPKAGSADSEKLKVLGVLIDAYEKQKVHFEKPSPIEFLNYRMEEMGLRQLDLVPFIGSKSKVSEVLSGKRPLTLQMIRNLNTGLGIPAEILIGEKDNFRIDLFGFQVSDFPLKEIIKRGWLKASGVDAKEKADELVSAFLRPLKDEAPTLAMLRTGLHERGKTSANKGALVAWLARVLTLANQKKLSAVYKKGTINAIFMKEVAQLSMFETGPLLAQEYLAKHGVSLTVEEHLAGTRLDGAAFLSNDGMPIVALTLRYDRLDSFWFTLMHELSHLAKHVDLEGGICFVDDLDSIDGLDLKESEADKLAKEAFIPREKWARSAAFRQKTKESILDLANELKISPAIVAGRLRYETNSYQDTILNQLVGQGQVRKIFGV